MDWRTLTLEELEANYNPRIAAPDFEARLAEYVARSAATRTRIANELDIAYGDGPLQTLDFFPPRGDVGEGGAPLHVVIHGGYWRGLDKGDFSFLAAPVTAAGGAMISLNYDLCPTVALDQIVDEIRQALLWIAANAARFAIDTGRITISGHSAGAHLAAMMLAHDWTGDGLPRDFLKGGVLVSGVYDPNPVPSLAVNAEIGLTPEVAERNNLLNLPPKHGGPVLLTVGEMEPDGWKAQSESFLRTCLAAGVDATLETIPGTDHFTIGLAMDDPGQVMLPAILAQMGLA